MRWLTSHIFMFHLRKLFWYKFRKKKFPNYEKLYEMFLFSCPKYVHHIWNEFPFFFFKVQSTMWVFPYEILLSSWGYPKSIKHQRKTYMTKWKVRKETVIDLLSLRVKKCWGEREGEEKEVDSKKGERRKFYLPTFSFNSHFFFSFNYENITNVKAGFNWLC